MIWMLFAYKDQNRIDMLKCRFTHPFLDLLRPWVPQSTKITTMINDGNPDRRTWPSGVWAWSRRTRSGGNHPSRRLWPAIWRRVQSLRNSCRASGVAGSLDSNHQHIITQYGCVHSDTSISSIFVDCLHWGKILERVRGIGKQRASRMLHMTIGQPMSLIKNIHPKFDHINLSNFPGFWHLFPPFLSKFSCHFRGCSIHVWLPRHQVSYLTSSHLATLYQDWGASGSSQGRTKRDLGMMKPCIFSWFNGMWMDFKKVYEFKSMNQWDFPDIYGIHGCVWQFGTLQNGKCWLTSEFGGTMGYPMHGTKPPVSGCVPWDPLGWWYPRGSLG